MWRKTMGKDFQSWLKILASLPRRTFTHTSHLLTATWRFLRAEKTALYQSEGFTDLPNTAPPSTWSDSQICTFTNKPATISLFSEPQDIILTWKIRYSAKLPSFHWNHQTPALLFWEIPVLCNIADKGGYLSKVSCSLGRPSVSDSSRSGQELTWWFT